MAAAADEVTEDIKYRIANALGDDVLREAIDAQEKFNSNVVQLREAYGVSIDGKSVV